MFIYVDESYFKGFVIKTAIAIPSISNVQEFNKAVKRDLIPKMPSSFIEYKASSISKGNRERYEELLKYIIYFNGVIAEKTSLRSVITFDAADTFKSTICDNLKRQLRNQVDIYGLGNPEYLYSDGFAEEIFWLHLRLPKICNTHNYGEIDLVFDEKYQLAKAFASSISFKFQGRTVTWPRWKFYKCAVNAVLVANKSIVAVNNNISSIRYIKSQADYLIQAADLLSNLTLNALRLKKGIASDKIILKSNLINAAIREEYIPDELAKDFDVIDNELACNNPKHRSSIELLP